MKRRSVSLFAGAVVALLFAGGSARADFVEFNYNWFPKVPSSPPYEIKSDNGLSSVRLSNESPGSASGASDLSATNIEVFSGAARGTPDIFSDGSFVLQLQLTDVASGASVDGGLLFAGKFTGEVSKSHAFLNVEFIEEGEMKKSYEVQLGNNIYTVTIGGYSRPGPPGSLNKGSIDAHVEVRPVDIQKSPEPSTMLLGCIGLAGMGLAGWRKRRQAARA